MSASRPTARNRSAIGGFLDGRGWVTAHLCADAVTLLLALLAGSLSARAAGMDTEGTVLVLGFPPLVMVLFALRGMYQSTIQSRLLDVAGRVVSVTSVAAMLVTTITALTGSAAANIGLIARTWVFSTLYVGAGRLLLSSAQRRARANAVIGKPTLILGAGSVGAQVERRLEEQPELGLRPLGYVDSSPAPAAMVPLRRAPILGRPEELPEIVERTGAEHAILAFLSSRGSDARLVPVLRQCDELGLTVSVVPRLFESLNMRVGIEHIGGMPLLRMRSINPKGWQFAVKYALDRAISAVLLVLAAPLLVAGAMAVKLSSPGPVFFRQSRVGRDGRPFGIFKFRTMKLPVANPSGALPVAGHEAPQAGVDGDLGPGGVEGEDRRTWVGKLLRRTSLDELPQLLNVLKGDMSLVGPRPERPQFAELFEQRLHRYNDRHRVKAGITGWAQVHGLRGNTSIANRIEWDNFYIENWSLRLDFKILLMTIAAVLRPAE